MFETAQNNLNFTCDYELKFKGELSFGWRCITPVESYLKDLARQLGKTSWNDLPSCDSVCAEVGDRQLNYDDFMATNITTLKSFCHGQSHCEFNVSVDYDFENKSWVRRDGTFIDDIEWKTSDFPQYKDIIVTHLNEYGRGSNWIGSSPDYHNRTGFYFCSGDQLSSSYLKNATYIQAKSDCDRIATLDLCNYRASNKELINMAKSINTEAAFHFDFMLTPIRFWTGTERLDQKRFVNENGTITTSPYCPVDLEDLCDDCPIEEKSLGNFQLISSFQRMRIPAKNYPPKMG